MEAASPVLLVACCGPKLAASARAADLYVSPLFKKSRTYAARHGRWYILSALHGLLDPRETIAPYNVTLKTLPAAQRWEWGRKVHQQMETAGLIGPPLVALAGADYVKPLLRAGLTITQPMQGLGIGQQLQWLTQQNEAALGDSGKTVPGPATEAISRSGMRPKGSSSMSKTAIPDGLTAEHVLRALADLDAGIDHPFGKSTGYDLVHNGKRYPPKAVVGLAFRYLTGNILAPDEFSGGQSPGQANAVLRKLGFSVIEKR